MKLMHRLWTKKYRFSIISSEYIDLMNNQKIKIFLRDYELEFCEKFTNQEVCFSEDEFSDCQCPQSVLFQKVYFGNSKLLLVTLCW